VPTNGTLPATARSVLLSLSSTTTAIYTLSLHDALPILLVGTTGTPASACTSGTLLFTGSGTTFTHTGLANGTTYSYRVCASDNRSEEHTSELQSRSDRVCRLLLEE